MNRGGCGIDRGPFGFPAEILGRQKDQKMDADLEEQVWREIELSRLLDVLSRRDRYIMINLLLGTSHAEIAEDLGLGRGRIGQIQKACMRKLAKARRFQKVGIPISLDRIPSFVSALFLGELDQGQPHSHH